MYIVYALIENKVKKIGEYDNFVKAVGIAEGYCGWVSKAKK